MKEEREKTYGYKLENGKYYLTINDNLVSLTKKSIQDRYKIGIKKYNLKLEKDFILISGKTMLKNYFVIFETTEQAEAALIWINSLEVMKQLSE